MLYCTLPVLASIPTPLANICTVQYSTTQQGILQHNRTGWYSITTAAMQYSAMPCQYLLLLGI